MAKTKQQKEQVIKELKESFSRQKAVVFVDFKGLKVEDMFNLRKRLKLVDGKLRVAKKTLIDLVIKDSEFKADVKNLEGEIALVFGFGDSIAPAKTVYNFSKENPNIKILGGFFENEFKGAEDFIAIAQLPSKDELLGRFVGSISSPVSNFVNVLEANLKGLIYTLNAITNK